jgi:hypothetical protein
MPGHISNMHAQVDGMHPPTVICSYDYNKHEGCNR